MLNYLQLSEFLLEEAEGEVTLALGELPPDELSVDLSSIELLVAEFMAGSVRTDLLSQGIQAIISQILLATLLGER